MKDMGLPPFNFQGELLEMELPSNVKQEHSVLPPALHPLPPSTHSTNGNAYGAHNGPTFSLSASPPQRSPMFMERIHPNTQRPVYPPSDFTVCSTLYALRSTLYDLRSLSIGPV